MNRTFGNIAGFTNQPQGLDVGLGGSAPWMADWSAYQSVFDWTGTKTSIPATTWNTFVNVASGSGWLTFVQSSAPGYNPNGMPDVKVTIDGISYIFNGNTVGASANVGNLISQPIFFKNSLKIEVYNSAATVQDYFCDYVYLLKNVASDPTKQSILLATSRNSGFNRNGTTAQVNIANITGSGYLLAIEFGMEDSGANDTATINGFVSVDGVTKMSDRPVISVSNVHKLYYFPGPIRFATSLLVGHRISSGTTAVANTRVIYTLD